MDDIYKYIMVYICRRKLKVEIKAESVQGGLRKFCIIGSYIPRLSISLYVFEDGDVQ